MVLLTITDSIISALDETRRLQGSDAVDQELPIDATLGCPISHAQLIHIAKILRQSHESSTDDTLPFQYSLDNLLRGCSIYTPPKPAKAEPTPEYKALMARLRKEQEAREYALMTAQNAQSASVQIGVKSRLNARDILSQDDADEMTLKDVNRQLTLIINVLVTIVACGIGIWLVASRWSVSSRLALSLGGSGLIGVAEVIVYAGYIRRLSEARSKETKVSEKKSIMNSWASETKPSSKSSGANSKQSSSLVRQRKIG